MAKDSSIFMRSLDGCSRCIETGTNATTEM